MERIMRKMETWLQILMIPNIEILIPSVALGHPNSLEESPHNIWI